MAHCPKSNAKLGCGVAPLADLLRQGVRVGFGTDSPASSNIMDMFDEMRTMLFLHRAVERDVTVLDAPKCVRIATLGGAEALGLEADVGTLEPGKYADFIAVDLAGRTSRPSTTPTRRWCTGPIRTTSSSPSSAADVLYRDTRSRASTPRRCGAPRVAVREKLRSRVRAGDVRVGAAESGWWHTARPSTTRGDPQVLLDRKRVKFWQKWVFCFMAVLMAAFLVMIPVNRSLGCGGEHASAVEQIDAEISQLQGAAAPTPPLDAWLDLAEATCSAPTSRPRGRRRNSRTGSWPPRRIGKRPLLPQGRRPRVAKQKRLDTLEQLATVYLNMQDYQSATACTSRSPACGPRTPVVLRPGHAGDQRRRRDTAMLAFTRFLELGPTSPDAPAVQGAGSRPTRPPRRRARRRVSSTGSEQ